MPYYIYEALDQSTHKFVEGRLEALNLREAKEVLRTQGQIPTSLNEDHSVGQVTSLIEDIPIIGELVSGTVSLKDVNIMTQQLYVLLDAGIPLIEGLFLLEQQTENKKLKAILKQVRSDVIAGESFSDNNIDAAPTKIITLNEAAIIHAWQIDFFQTGTSGTDFL